MCNAANKLFMTAMAVISLTACGPNADREAADRLVAQAQGALDRGNYDSAFIYLDSLSASYPSQIEAGRRGLALRPRAIAGKTQQEIMEMQVQLQAVRATVDSLMPQFTVVPPSEELLEGYYVHKDAPANFREQNTIMARVTPKGEFVVVSSLAGRSTRHTAVKLSSGAEEAVTNSVKFDDALPLSRESVRFASGGADALGDLAVGIDDGRTATVTFLGPQKQPSVKISGKELHAIADSRRLAVAMSAIAPMASRLEQLKAKLQLARDQEAREIKD